MPSERRAVVYISAFSQLLSTSRQLFCLDGYPTHSAASPPFCTFTPRSAKYVIWKRGPVVLLLNLCPLFEPHTSFCWLEQPKLTTYLGEIRLGVPVEIQGFDRVTIGLAPQHERVLGPLNPATVRGLRLLLPSYLRGTLHPGFNVERGSAFSCSIPTFLK